MTPHPLALEGATKRFGGFIAVDSMSFEVPQGAIVGFLGPNGAGKSTSLRMALGVIAPDEGEARLFGERPNLENLRNVGFLPEERGLYKKMSPRATIAYFARLKGMSAGAANRRADELLEAAGLGIFARSKISKLSKGMAQKVQILSTLAHEPELLILDEPFSGLDPVNQTALEDLIVEQHKRGATILFSTHVMEHAERLCERIIMCARGRKVLDGTLEEALAMLGRVARISLASDFDLESALRPKGFEVLREEGEGRWYKVALPNGVDAQEALQASIQSGAPIAGFMPEQARLRDVFVSLVSEADAAALDASNVATTEPAHA